MNVRWRIIICLQPLIIALMIAFVLSRGWLTNYVFVAQYSIDSIALVSSIGLFLTVLAFGGLVMAYWHVGRVKLAQLQMHEDGIRHHKRFLQRLDHEIKNPLTTMQLGILNILDNEAIQDSDRHRLERMQTQVNRLRQLVMDLRSLTELEDRMVERSQLNIEVVIRDAIETIPKTGNRMIDLSAQKIPWEVGKVIGDLDLLMIAFTNILNNAVKFTAQDGNIHIQITDDGQWVLIEIADNGIGIPSAELNHVFDELYRASNAQRMSGSGMGLALVHRIVELHHGTVNMRSRESHGTSTIVRLPLANKS